MIQSNTQGVALITGGSRRIGAAICKKLHAKGFKVVIHCHQSFQEAHTLAKEFNQKRPDSALVLQRDLRSCDRLGDLISDLLDWGNRLDVLVNNASIFPKTDITTLQIPYWDELFDTNVKAPFLLSLAAREALKKQQGSIINITDVHAQKPLLAYSAYCQSKAAFQMQTLSLAYEFAPEIRVNAVAPGAIAWPEKANALSIEQQKKIIDKTALKKHGDPEFIAQAVLALVENPFITGQILQVDGGRAL